MVFLVIWLTVVRLLQIEYHRQGMNQEFDAVLTEIVSALEDACMY